MRLELDEKVTLRAESGGRALAGELREERQEERGRRPWSGAWWLPSLGGGRTQGKGGVGTGTITSVGSFTLPSIPASACADPVQGRNAHSHYFLCHIKRNAGWTQWGSLLSAQSSFTLSLSSESVWCLPCFSCTPPGPEVSSTSSEEPFLSRHIFPTPTAFFLPLGQPACLGLDSDTTSYCQDLFES